MQSLVCTAQLTPCKMQHNLGILLHVALKVELQVLDMFYLRNMMESSQVEVSFIVLLSLLKNSRNNTVELQCNVSTSFQIPDLVWMYQFWSNVSDTVSLTVFVHVRSNNSDMSQLISFKVGTRTLIYIIHIHVNLFCDVILFGRFIGIFVSFSVLVTLR